MKIVNKIKSIRHYILREIYRHNPLKKNKIIFWANSFKQYGCNPKYITEYILNNYPEKFDLVWVFDYKTIIPQNMDNRIKIVRYFSIDYIRELHTAKFVVCNMRTGEAYYWKKRKGQIYIQTWHSSLRLKKIEADALGHLSKHYIEECKSDSKKIDILLSGCAFSSKIFKRAFWYDGVIMESGTPRCDILLNNTSNTKRKIYDYYNIPENNKMILYAPTFRTNKASDFLGMEFDRLKNILGCGWSIGARLHPNILTSIEPEDAIPMNNYPDMQELIVATDILITDFSSCMFDMAIARKPCILFVPDLDDYLNNERGLYFDIEKLPFPIARDMDDLCVKLLQFNDNQYLNELNKFMNDIGSFEDGHAAERICSFMLQNIK